MLRNGFGEHNIQGIGDKHIPLIHNVMNTDLVVDISDRATDRLLVLFNTDAGRAHLAARGVPGAVLAALPSLGISSICNILAAIRTAKQLDLGPDDAVVTVATDGAAMYLTEVDKILARDFAAGFGPAEAAETFGQLRPGRRHRRSPGADPGRARADLQPRLLHLGGAAGRRVRRLRRPPRPGLLARPAGQRAGLGRGDREMNARAGVEAGA